MAVDDIKSYNEMYNLTQETNLSCLTALFERYGLLSLIQKLKNKVKHLIDRLALETILCFSSYSGYLPEPVSFNYNEWLV